MSARNPKYPMIESRLVSKKKSFEIELKRGVSDPKRRQYLVSRLLQIENDIRALGLTPEEIKTNNVQTGTDGGKTISGQQFLVPPPSWVSELPDKTNRVTNETNQETHQDRIKAAREAAYARLAALESAQNKK